MAKHRVTTTGVANLYRRGTSRVLYMKFYFMGRLVHRSTGTDDPELAQLAIQQAQREIYKEVMTADTPKVSQITLSKAVQEVYTERWQTNTAGAYQLKQAEKIVDILGDVPLYLIDTKKVRQVQTTLLSVLSCEPTVNRYMAAFRTVLKHASESYGTPYPKFQMYKEERGRIKVYTPDEERTIKQWFVTNGLPEMADLTTVLIDTGFRLSEALGIGRRNDKGQLISEVHFDRHTLSSWRNKGTKARTIPMTSRVYRVFEQRGSQPFSYNKDQAVRLWGSMRDSLGLDAESVAHVCRHTCASRLLAAGKSLLVVQQWLGHADIKTTMIYTHLMPGALDDAVAALEGIY